MKCTKCQTEYEGNFCPNCGVQATEPSKSCQMFGFRSNTTWNKILSIIYLVFIGIAFISVFALPREGKVTVYDYSISKIYSVIVLIALLSPYLFLSNTALRRKLPLFKDNRTISSILGMCIAVLSLAAIAVIVNNLHSDEFLADQKNHSYVEVYRSEPGDGLDGKIEYRCDYCGATKTEYINADGSSTNGAETNSQGDVSVPDHQPECISISAKDLYEESKSASFNKTKYNNKKLRITGTLLNISDYSNLKGYYLYGGKGTGIVGWVDGKSLEAKPGQVMIIEGIATTTEVGHIELSNCTIVSAEWPEVKPESPVVISDWTWTRDSAGGVEWNFRFTNNDSKTIKYITMEWYCYNAVGDLVYDEITRTPNYTIKYTGPLEPNQTTELLRNTKLFYNYDFHSSKWSTIKVEYMDGTVIQITSNGYSNVFLSD